MNKRKKPTFPRQNAHRKKRVDSKWRRPKGMDSKQAKGKKSRGKTPNIGYRQPKAIRGRHPTGLIEILITNIKDIQKIANPKQQAARISAKIGKRKKQEILKIAKEKGIKVLNNGA